MTFAAKKLPGFQLRGDWAVDGPRMIAWIDEHFRALESPNSLAIAKAKLAADFGIKFPATQYAVTDANTLDDYAEVSWTPAGALATPGSSSFSATIAVGDATKIGRLVVGSFRYAATLTIGTGSGTLKLTGLPYTASSDANFIWDGALVWAGITMPGGRTQLASSIVAGTSEITFSASGSATTAALIVGADVTGSLVLRGSFAYRV